MTSFLYHTFVFITLFSYGLYHLILSTRSHFKNPSTHAARPYHPLPISPHRHHLLRHLPLYLSLLSLLISISYHLHLSLSSSSPLAPLSSLHSALSLSLFFLLALSLLLLPLPSDLLFLLSSLAFLLLSLSPSSSSSSSPYLDLQSKTHSLSSSISLSSASFSLALSLLPSAFLFEISLSSSLCLRGLWSLQTALALYVDPFIPLGCHRLLDVADPITRCDIEESMVRAGMVLNLALAAHAVLVAIVAVLVYAVVGKAFGGLGVERGLRRLNGGTHYESLPRAASCGTEMDHLQMKAIGKSSAQA